MVCATKMNFLISLHFAVHEVSLEMTPFPRRLFPLSDLAASKSQTYRPVLSLKNCISSLLVPVPRNDHHPSAHKALPPPAPFLQRRLQTPKQLLFMPYIRIPQTRLISFLLISDDVGFFEPWFREEVSIVDEWVEA